MSTIIILIAIVLNGIISNIIGNVGKTKQIGYSTSFWVSFLFSPLIGLLLVIASNPLTKEEIEELNKPKVQETKEINPDQNNNKSLYIIIGIVILIFILIGTGVIG